MSSFKKLAVLGAGAWGTALANTLCSRGEVVLWGRNESDVKEITRIRQNKRYLPGIDLHPDLKLTHNLEEALEKCDAVLLVVPVKATSEIGGVISSTIEPQVPIVCCSKGIDPAKRATPTAMLRQINSEANVFSLSGPSFAADVVRGLPTAVVLAHDRIEKADQWAEKLSCDKFRIYSSDDLTGVELGGALKNVIALAVGVCRGLKLGASAEAAVIARGFSEISKLIIAMGGRGKTLNGLSGMGDLVLSCSNEKSRNFSYGIALGQESSLLDLPLAEGVRTAKIASDLAAAHGLECPIIGGITAVLNEEISAQALVEKLLNRPLTRE